MGGVHRRGYIHPLPRTSTPRIKLTSSLGKTIDNVHGGHNGIETRLMIAYSEGVAKGRISLQRFVELTSTNAAKILGMYPRKGAISVGSDADITIIDPNAHKTIGPVGPARGL